METSPAQQPELTPPSEEWEEAVGQGADGADEEEVEEESAEEEEGQGKVGAGGGVGGGGYACRICGFHAGDVRGLSQHLHTVHPVTGLAPLSACESEPTAKEGGASPVETDGGRASQTGGVQSERGSPSSGQGCPQIPNGKAHAPAGRPAANSEGSGAGGGSGHNRTSVVCLPLVAEGLKLVWMRSDQTEELDQVPELVQAFNAFPYPTLQEVGVLSLRCALPVDTVKVWFMVQRIRYGISWAAEEIEETRRKLCGLQLQERPPGDEEEEEEDEDSEDDVCAYRAESWGSGPRRCHRDSGLLRRRRPAAPPRCPYGRRPAGSRRRLDAAPSPLFVMAPPGWRGSVRGRKSKAQLRALRRSFLRDSWLSEAELRRLQVETGLTRAEVRKWFSDSRYQLRNNGQRPPCGGHAPADGHAPTGGHVPAGGHAPTGPEDAGFAKEDKGAAGRGPRERLGRAMKEEEEEEEETARGEKDAPLGDPASSTPSPPSPPLGSALLTSTGRMRKTKEQLAVLKQFFLRCQWPSSEDYTRLVGWTGLPRADVIQWFGDARYRVKNGNLRWVRDEKEHQQIVAEISGPGRGRRRLHENGADATEVAAPPASNGRSGSDSLGAGPGEESGAEKGRSAGGAGNSGMDIRPLEMYWRHTGALQEKDLDALCRKAGMGPQQVRDWFTFQESGMAEVEVNISD
ncbi:hypothetical protein MATL_G00199500 [Megalops atlanticus]|uniref:Homeobox domain-containing protein n=1 Tax=Megalops atlanticus TaxID=7932 RepID=A0A9D3PLY5_MEGAT|nr:hypothetical protein MATL_G00199500 [Megalops atlanticus]